MSFKKFVSWMEYNPPVALSADGWVSFTKEYKELAPIRYWVMNDLRDGCRKFASPLTGALKAMDEYLIYNVLNRAHVVDSKLKPGYHEKDTLLLHASFAVLVDFVERECAACDYYGLTGFRLWVHTHVPYFRYIDSVRNKELGIKFLEEQANSTDPQMPAKQITSAAETLKLYRWWVDVRPNRAEEDGGQFDDQGLGHIGFLGKQFNRDAEDFKEWDARCKRNAKLQEQWIEEDTDMLVRLMKVRTFLWT